MLQLKDAPDEVFLDQVIQVKGMLAKQIEPVEADWKEDSIDCMIVNIYAKVYLKIKGCCKYNISMDPFDA